MLIFSLWRLKLLCKFMHARSWFDVVILFPFYCGSQAQMLPHLAISNNHKLIILVGVSMKTKKQKNLWGRGPGRVPTLTPAQWQKVAWSDELEFFLSGSAAPSTRKLYGDRPVRRSQCCALDAELPSMRMLLWHAPTMEVLLLTLHACKWKWYFLMFGPF